MGQAKEHLIVAMNMDCERPPKPMCSYTHLVAGASALCRYTHLDALYTALCSYTHLVGGSSSLV